MKNINTYFKPLAIAGRITVVSLAALLAPVSAYALAGNIGGTAYLTYDQAAWSTMRNESYRTDTHGITLNDGALEPTSDTYGNRFFYPQLFVGNDAPAPIKAPGLASDARIAAGTADPEAVAQWRVFDSAKQIPAVQPAGGWAMSVDSLAPGLDPSWAAGYTPSYTADPNDSAISEFYSLGGSLRLHSDFIAPSGTLWFRGLDLRQEYGVWSIGSTAFGQASGSIFELINPVFSVNPESGLMSLEADYKWGGTRWSSFLGFEFDQNGNLNPDGQKVLGHISMNPSAVPVPAAVWLFGSALFGLASFRRKNVS